MHTNEVFYLGGGGGRERERDGGGEEEMGGWGVNGGKEGEWVVELRSSCKREWQRS